MLLGLESVLFFDEAIVHRPGSRDEVCALYKALSV